MSSSIQILDSSIQTLISSWQRRQTWLHHLLSIHQDQNFTPNWRTHLVNFLESTWIHVFSIFLLMLDLIITSLELSSSLLSCNNKNSPNHQNRTPEKENSDFGFISHWIGIGILCLLSAKSVALIVGLGISFFKHGGYVVDGSVVFGALILEAFLEKKGGGLVVVMSLWRVIRVVESAFELSDEAIEAQIEGIVSQFEEIRDENRRLLDTIQALKEDLDQCCCQSNTNSFEHS